jgi:selenocysteine lyase/cysteine desulfurase
MVGPDKIEARVLQLAGALKSRLQALDIRIATPSDPALSGGVVILQTDSSRGREAFQTLHQKWGIAGAATGGVRLCPHIYNTMAHVDRAVEGIRSVRRLFV